MVNFREKANFIWSVADLLRGDFKQSDYGKVILPLTVLRRLDSLLEPTKDEVLTQYDKFKGQSDEVIDRVLNRASGYKFHNRSLYSFRRLVADPDNIAANLRAYINGFSTSVRDIMEQFRFDDQIERLDKADLLYIIVKRFSEIDLAGVDSLTMGYIFEELIRKFAEISNETAGEHFTPREVIELMVNLLFMDEQDIYKKGAIRTLYDPTAGTGGMLSTAEAFIKRQNPDATLLLFGQEINPESYAICKADMLIKGQEPGNIRFGDTLKDDQHTGEKFNYMLANPPFGVDWKKSEKVVKAEYEKKGYAGRFGPGLPRINDGSLLFLLHMISKMKSEQEGGSRLGIVLNGSPLFTGGAGSGESEIRKWIIENDMLEAIVALPDQLFYNTGISTYIWIVTNHKTPQRKGKVQLINATGFFQKMSRSLGNKRNEIAKGQIQQITELYGAFKPGEYVKIYPNAFFGYSRITVERPLRQSFQYEPWTEDEIIRVGTTIPYVDMYLEKLEKEFGRDIHYDANEANKRLVEVYKSMPLQIADLHNIGLGFFKKDPKGEPIRKPRPKADEHPFMADADLRDAENVPLQDDIAAYFEREVLPHVPDAWIDHSKSKVGYEINFTKYFYQYKPLRSLAKIRADILALEEETEGLIHEVLD